MLTEHHEMTLINHSRMSHHTNCIMTLINHVYQYYDNNADD